ncbi:MAG TPA: adenylate/guanylate cyclase domain-containing protein [Myxococcales bacterium]|nr:adenylate/guanylate cyclase domain-containing protein [Myxococcales bacterium]
MSSGIRAVWAGWLALGGSILLFALHPWLLDRAEYSLLDARFRLRGPVPVTSPVTVVAIDAASLDEFGRWPWRRSLLADLVDRLVEAGVVAIGLDLVFSENETPPEASALGLARRVLAEQTPKSAPVDEAIASLDRTLARTDTDARLAGALSASRRAALGYFFRTGIDEADPPATLAARLPEIARSQVSVARVPARGRAPILTCTGLETNVPVIQQAGRRSGFLSSVGDPDGVIRRAALIARCGDSYYVSLALAVYELVRDQRAMVLGDAHGLREVRVGDRSIPTDEGGKITINFRGPPATFARVSAGDVLAGRLAPGQLEGAIALVGPTEVGLGDTQTTPFPGVFPGVEVHANVLDNLLAGDGIRRDDGLVVAELTLIILIGLLLIFVIPRTKGVLMSFVFAGGLAVFLVIMAIVAFVEYGLWFNLIYPLTTVAGVYLAVEVPRSLAMEARGRRIRNMFATYVPPSVVKQLAEGDAELRLGGETRTLTILFSDVRNFTQLSERLGAEDTIRLMNAYLAAMTRIIFETGGTLDKYIGDAVMAFWGAPLSLEDHAERAGRAAVQMQEAVSEFAELHPGLPGSEGLRVGIGLHTAPVVVGNLGSDLRFDYTLIGDGVNLCSRLEGLTKAYGVGVLASEELVGGLPDSFLTRAIDEIRVKGREGAGMIYEVLGERDARPEEIAWLEAHATGLALYRAGRWEQARAALNQAIAGRGDDPPSRALLARMAELGGGAPDGWSGIWSFETK